MDAPHDSRSAISALLAAHVHFGDSGQVKAMVGLYAPDGVYELPNGTTLSGVEQIEQVLSGASSSSSADGWGLTYMRHHLTTSHIELLNKITARADTYFVNINNKGVDHWGRWQDELTRSSDGQWLFTRRIVVVEGSHPESWFQLASGLA